MTVAPHAGVWIEIFDEYAGRKKDGGRSPRGSVD